MSDPHPIAPVKPVKPSPDLLLTAHLAGDWGKKIRGKPDPFGPWADPDRVGVGRGRRTRRRGGAPAGKRASPTPSDPMPGRRDGDPAQAPRGSPPLALRIGRFSLLGNFRQENDHPSYARVLPG